jgi:hypothetical protein
VSVRQLVVGRCVGRKEGGGVHSELVAEEYKEGGMGVVWEWKEVMSHVTRRGYVTIPLLTLNHDNSDMEESRGKEDPNPRPMKRLRFTQPRSPYSSSRVTAQSSPSTRSTVYDASKLNL